MPHMYNTTADSRFDKWNFFVFILHEIPGTYLLRFVNSKKKYNKYPPPFVEAYYCTIDTRGILQAFIFNMTCDVLQQSLTCIKRKVNVMSEKRKLNQTIVNKVLM